MTSVLVHNTAAGTVRAKTKKADKVALKIATALVDGVQCHAGSSCSSQYNSCQLDKCIVEIRDACCDSSIDQVARLHLLEVVELRGNKWHQNENIAAYYRERLAKLKMDDPELMTSVPSNIITLQNSQTQGPLASHAPTLMPGEILKNSGKFTAPSKIPGKIFLKDEVIIRNADSGKVMGRKGLRVHLIQEISETIISFQRVPAVAKERLVQITGPGEENIEFAKELIADVIRRNASPVQTEGIWHQMRVDSSSSVSSSGLDDNLVSGHKSKRASYDHSGMEYRYTATFGGESVKIVGKDFEMVQWEAFTIPELETFLRILESEETEYRNQIRRKYKNVRDQMLLLDENRNNSCSILPSKKLVSSSSSESEEEDYLTMKRNKTLPLMQKYDKDRFADANDCDSDSDATLKPSSSKSIF